MIYVAKYLVFEGIDGCGKTTQVQSTRDKLIELDKDVIRLREPTKDSYFGRLIRERLFSGTRDPWEEEKILFEEDRAWHSENRIRHALSLNAFVLQDRNYLSTAAYQGRNTAECMELFYSNEKLSYMPNIIFLFDLDVDETMNRLSQRAESKSTMENKKFLEGVRKNYLMLYETFRDRNNIRLIDASKNVDEITTEIMSIIASHSML